MIGTSSVKATLLKDGHCFSVHILDPKEPSEESDVDDDDDDESKKDEKEKSEYEKSEKDGKKKGYMLGS